MMQPKGHAIQTRLGADDVMRKRPGSGRAGQRGALIRRFVGAAAFAGRAAVYIAAVSDVFAEYSEAIADDAVFDPAAAIDDPKLPS